MPAFTVTDAKFTIDTKKSTIELTGGVAEYLYTLIIDIFKQELFNYLIREMDDLLKTSAQDYVNQMIASNLQELSLFNNIGLDLTLSGNTPYDVN